VLLARFEPKSVTKYRQVYVTDIALADPGGGGRFFFCPKRYCFSIFSSLDSLVINFSIILIEIWSEHAKNDFYFNL